MRTVLNSNRVIVTRIFFKRFVVFFINRCYCITHPDLKQGNDWAIVQSLVDERYVGFGVTA